VILFTGLKNQDHARSINLFSFLVSCVIKMIFGEGEGRGLHTRFIEFRVFFQFVRESVQSVKCQKESSIATAT